MSSLKKCIRVRENQKRIKKRERVIKKKEKKLSKNRLKKKIRRHLSNVNKRYQEEVEYDEEYYGKKVPIYCNVINPKTAEMEQRVYYGNSNFDKNGNVVPYLKQTMNSWAISMLENLRDTCDYCAQKSFDCYCDGDYNNKYYNEYNNEYNNEYDSE